MAAKKKVSKKKTKSVGLKLRDMVFGKNNPLIKKSDEAIKKLLPEANKTAAKRQAGANKLAETVKASRKTKKKKSKGAPMKGKINRTPVKQNQR